MDKHEEWIKSLVNHDSKVEDDDLVENENSAKSDNSLPIILIGFFLLALILRLIFIFKIGDPDNPGAGWFGDAYHHWQIAYLTKEVGLKEGFLRLWDLKGMEFFWGLLHPLLTIFAFVVTGSVNVGVERGLTAVFGSLSVSLTYLVVNKYFNKKAAIGAAILAALNPVGVFNDGSGMVEPLGIPFLLLGIYFWPKKPFLAGFSFFIALMARAEYWVFAIGLIIATFIINKNSGSNRKAGIVLGLLIPLIFYMKYLLDYTGNPIYPFYQNYLTNIYGTWQFKTEFTTSDIIAKHIFQGIFGVSALLSAFVLWKKPRGSLVYLLGLGNWLFLGASIGLGAYIGSYASYVWYVRFMILPYIFIGMVISIFLFYYLPKIKYLALFDKLKINWLVLFLILALSQPVWILIMDRYVPTQKNWGNAVRITGEIFENYKGGRMVFIEGNPEFTYALVKVYGFDGSKIVSQMFDPYFYMTDDPYKNWDDNREVVFEWLKKFEVQTIVTYTGTEKYAKLAEFEPEYISTGKQLSHSNLTVYQVNNEKIQQDF